MLHTLYLMGFSGNKHLSFPLRPKPDKNGHPVSIKPFVNTGNAQLHFIQNINNPPGLPVLGPLILLYNGSTPSINLTLNNSIRLPFSLSNSIIRTITEFYLLLFEELCRVPHPCSIPDGGEA